MRINFEKTISINLLKHKVNFKIYELIPLLLILVWCLPYFTSGNKIELGDFSFFSQAYEAMRISIFQYHQFPWVNPWVSGGVPLYGNPQMGVFSIENLFTLIFGAPIGLKIAIFVYTVLGYGSVQLLLRKYFKVTPLISIISGLAWISSSFFVAHLPSHFSFVWYMVAPLFIYLALTIKDLRSGIFLGTGFAAMALSQVHNAFFHIAFVCIVILIGRLIFDNGMRLRLLAVYSIAALSFLILAGHRVFFAAQNAMDFPRNVTDPHMNITDSIMAFFLPMSRAHDLGIKYPKTEYGWGEVTASIGVIGSIMFISLLVLFITHSKLFKKRAFNHIVSVIFALIILILIGLGNIGDWSPYTYIKSLPIYENMRVSSRWFVFVIFAQIIVIALLISNLKIDKLRKIFTIFFALVVAELFIMNVGYQYKILTYQPSVSKESVKSLAFKQSTLFGDAADNQIGPPKFYREYEATTFNTGVLKANDTLVELKPEISPRCSYLDGCGLVISNNAVVVLWSPNKIVLKRTGAGPIELNLNNSSYYLINGVRNPGLKVAEPYQKFIIENLETEQNITIHAKPAIIAPVMNKIRSKF